MSGQVIVIFSDESELCEVVIVPEGQTGEQVFAQWEAAEKKELGLEDDEALGYSFQEVTPHTLGEGFKIEDTGATIADLLDDSDCE